MAFQYRLESLLRLQRSLEQQEENRLSACNARVSRLLAELQSLQELRWERKRAAFTNEPEGTPAAFLRFAVEWEESARRREKEIREQLKAAEDARQKQMLVYRQGRKKREILESLKDRQESAYTAEQLRRAQQILDETHLLRSFHSED
jgi:flagellar export protein FliJ